MEHSASNESSKNTTGIKDLIINYLKYLPWVILSVIAALAVAVVYFRYVPKVYRATGLLQIVKEGGSSRSGGGGENVERFSSLFGGGSVSDDIKNEIEIIKSTPVLARVVQKMNGNFEYWAKEDFRKPKNIYKASPFVIIAEHISDTTKSFSLEISFTDDKSFQVNGVKQTYQPAQSFTTAAGRFILARNGTIPALPGVAYTVTWHPSEQLAERLVNGMSVMPKSQGVSIVAISIETGNPWFAADFVNNLMIQYDSITVEENNYSNNLRSDFVNSSIEKLKPEIDSLKNADLAIQEQYNLYAAEEQTVESYKKITELEMLIEEQQMKIASADLVIGYLKNKNYKYKEVSPSAMGIDDPQLNILIESYNSAQVERQRLLNSNVAPGHSMVITVEDQIEDYRKRILGTITNIKSGYEKTASTLRKNTGENKNELQKLPPHLAKLAEIRRQLETKLALFSILEEKKLEIGLTKASGSSKNKIIQKAKAVDYQVSPVLTKIMALAFLIGILIPVVIIFLKELLNDKIIYKKDITGITGIPIVAEIGQPKSYDKLIVADNNNNRAGEQVRMLRTRLDQQTGDHQQHTITLISEMREGNKKEFVSANLAAAYALAGKKTLLIEGDFRNHYLGKIINTTGNKGLSDYLAGEASVNEIIVPVPGYDHLFYVPAGTSAKNPADLWSGNQVESFFNYCKTGFQRIVIDVAPVGQYSDALSLADYADTTVIAVKQKLAVKKDIQQAGLLLAQKQFPQMVLAVTGISSNSGYDGFSGSADNRSVFKQVLYALNPLNLFRKN